MTGGRERPPNCNPGNGLCQRLGRTAIQAVYPRMPIQTRAEMLATGIRSALSIKVFGPDLPVIEETGIAIAKALQQDDRTAHATRSALAGLDIFRVRPGNRRHSDQR